MSTISNLSGLQPIQQYSPSAMDRSLVSGTDKTNPSAVVHLSPKGLKAAERAGIEAAMQHVSASVRFYDIGRTILANFNTGPVSSVNQLELPGHLDNKFTLDVVTNSDKRVSLMIANAGPDMFVQINASDDLSTEEREAIGKLAQGFQSAIDGLTRTEPQVRLGAFTQFDTGVLQSIDVQARVTLETVPPATQSLEFHIDSKQRKLSSDGPSGKLELSADTSKLPSLGTSQQQAKAIDRYLKQFDQVATRGQGNPHLMTMFKDAFSDMNRVPARDDLAGAGLATVTPWKPSIEDRSVLTGLPDFTATVTQAPRWSNPQRRDEVDSFEYKVSQNTQFTGESLDNRSIRQVQTSNLAAQFHTEPNNDRKLKLNIMPNELNYHYHQIDDSASSVVELGYTNGKLTKARLEQSVSESQRIRKYALGKLVSDHTNAGKQQLVRDLVALLAPYQSRPGETSNEETAEAAAERRQSSLDALNENMLLLGTRRELADRNKRL